MRAWRVNADFSRVLSELPKRAPPPGGATLRMQSAPVLSYLKQVIEGGLSYLLPPAPFTPGTNGIGVIEAVGPGVKHLVPGQRVILDPHLVVDERVREPAQILPDGNAIVGVRRHCRSINCVAAGSAGRHICRAGLYAGLGTDALACSLGCGFGRAACRSEQVCSALWRLHQRRIGSRRNGIDQRGLWLLRFSGRCSGDRVGGVKSRGARPRWWGTYEARRGSRPARGCRGVEWGSIERLGGVDFGCGRTSRPRVGYRWACW